MKIEFRGAIIATVEEDDKIEFNFCGEVVKKNIQTIEEACKNCDGNTLEYFDSKDECKEYQAKDARLRGFKKLICPEQIIKDD